MTFFPDPIKPSEGRQDDAYKVNPIEADPYKKGSFLQDQGQEKRSNFFAIFLVFLRYLIQIFNGKNSGQRGKTSLTGLLRGLETFKALLVQMQRVDQSENSMFCAALSIAWVDLFQETQVLSHIKEKQRIDLKGLVSLIDDINYFPRDKEHQLGYYLSRYAGNRWLPFPFREILRDLHLDHQTNGEKSILSQWIQTIDTLL